MSLITCCPSCGTRFRVVADQLRISDGWVRCGRCQEVFDATLTLEKRDPVQPPPVAGHPDVPRSESGPPGQDVPVQLPQNTAGEHQAPAPTGIGQPSVVPQAQVQVAAQGYELPVPADPDHDEPWLDEQVLPAPSGRLSGPQQSRPSSGDAHETTEAAPARLEPHWTQDGHAPALPAEEAQALAWAEAWRAPIPLEPETVLPEDAAADVEAADTMDAAVAQPSPDTQALPSFVRQARRRAWWSKPAVRFVMGMLVILLPLALVLQIAVHERSTLVAWKPQWRPAMDMLCMMLRCEIAPRRDIAAVVLTGSSFQQAGPPYHYELGLSMQNQSKLAVATPALELTLTDVQDQVLVRKIFTSQEIGAPQELAARSEWTGTLPLKIQGLHLPVSGYRLMAFYP